MRILSLLFIAGAFSAAPESAIIYGETERGAPLTMRVEPAAGPGGHPAALVIRTGLDFDPAALLAPLGIAVFSIDLAPAPAGWRASTGYVRRAIRYLRHHSARWQVDPARITLIAAGTGGYVANLAGVMGPDPAPHAKDPVNRDSAAVQAVVVFNGLADLRGQDLPQDLRSLLIRDIETVGEPLALSGASPVMHIRDSAPPFLLLHGDRDEVVPMSQSAHWQLALQNRGIRADLILIEGGGHRVSEWNRIPGVRDWQREMVEWLAAVFGRR